MPQFVGCHRHRSIHIFTLPHHHVLQQSRVDIDACVDKSVCISNGCFGGSRFYILFNFLEMLVVSFSLERELFDAVGELLIVNFELKFRYFGDIKRIAVHALQ